MEEEFEIFEHTAEVGFRAFGKSLEEAFSNAGRATFSIMVDLEEISAEETVSFGIESENRKALLYDFLDELIYLRDVKDMVFSRFDVRIEESEKGLSLECEAEGRKIGGMPGHDVKAVTYSQMEVEEKDGSFMVQVVLDV